MKHIPMLGVLLCWISTTAAQAIHVEPANPVLIGEPVSIKLDGLPSDKNVALIAERTLPAADPTAAPQANARAQARAFPQTIAFLKRTLGVE